MSRRSRLRGWFVFLAVCGAWACAPTPQPALDDEQREKIAAAVSTTFRDYVSALNDGELDRALAFYADDPRFAWIENGTLRYKSREEIARGFAALHAFGSLRVDSDPPAVTVLGPDVALLYATHRTVIAEGTEGEFSFSGATTITLLRGAAGWVFLQGHASSAAAGND